MDSDVKNKKNPQCPNVDPRIGRFPERLKEAINGQSINSFSRQVGISGTVVGKYLSGDSEPTRPVLISMADAAEVSVQWLATGEGRKEKVKVVDDSDRLASSRFIQRLLLDTFEYNKAVKKHNTLAVFLAYFSDQQKESLLDVSHSVALVQGRERSIIYCNNKTLIEISEELTKAEYKTNFDAFCAIEDEILSKNSIFIFCDLSKSKHSDNKSFYKDILKIFDRGFSDNRSDVVFIDTPSFLEKNWEGLGAYLETNILNGSSFFI